MTTPINSCDSPKIALVPYREALEKLLSHAHPVNESQILPLNLCLNRIMAEDLISNIDVPPADNSAMDGYAIMTSDINSGSMTTLKVTQRISAGSCGEALEKGCAARIFTGAPVPVTADAIIMQEQVDTNGGRISFSTPVIKGQNIRQAGEDIKQGEVIIKKGTQLRAQELGLAASVGEPDLTVSRPIKVGIFFTGDELIEPGQPLAPGKIYDSNRYTLNGLLLSLGCEIVDLGIVGDTLEKTIQAIENATQKTDLVITSGGVSVGEEDHVRIALEKMGELHMWRLKIKPGKPLAFGHVNNTAFIGLPGNPVSAFATFCLFVSPFIKKLQGRSKLMPESMIVTAGFTWPKPDTRREFIRARLEKDENNQSRANIYHHQGSGVLMSTSWADGFIEVPESTTIQPGDPVTYFSFSEILN